MEYRRLGNSGLKVSTLCLGAMMFGDRTDEAVAGRIVDSAFDAGVNFIDTADSYAKGGSERMVGKLIAKNRERWVLATKVQNAMNRLAEAEMFPACQYYGLGVVPYSPLARGVLTGKYAPGGKPSGDTRAGRSDRRMLEAEFREESIRHAQRIKAHAETRGMTAGQFALNWVLNNALVTAVIAGPRTEEQWREYLRALEHKLDAGDEALVDSLVAPGHTSTPGYTDPKFPVLGRIPRT